MINNAYRDRIKKEHQERLRKVSNLDKYIKHLSVPEYLGSSADSKSFYKKYSSKICDKELLRLDTTGHHCFLVASAAFTFGIRVVKSNAHILALGEDGRQSNHNILGPVLWYQNGDVLCKLFDVVVPYQQHSAFRSEYVHLQTKEDRENFLGYVHALVVR